MRNTPPIETINKKSTCRFQFLGLQFVSHLRILHVLINKGEVWNLLQLKWQKSRNSRKLQAFLFFYHGKIAKWEYTEKCCEAWIVVLSAVKSLSPVQQAFLHNPCVSAAISQWNLNYRRFLQDVISPLLPLSNPYSLKVLESMFWGPKSHGFLWFSFNSNHPISSFCGTGMGASSRLSL